MHLESESETCKLTTNQLEKLKTDDERWELVSSTLNSNADVYGSICRALKFSKCNALIRELRKLHILSHNP